jgi:hypothetical protein
MPHIFLVYVHVHKPPILLIRMVCASDLGNQSTVTSHPACKFTCFKTAYRGVSQIASTTVCKDASQSSYKTECVNTTNPAF